MERNFVPHYLNNDVKVLLQSAVQQEISDFEAGFRDKMTTNTTLAKVILVTRHTVIRTLKEVLTPEEYTARTRLILSQAGQSSSQARISFHKHNNFRKISGEGVDNSSEAIAQRVQRLIDWENNNPASKRKPFHWLITNADYELYHSQHPEWQGLSSAQLFKLSGGYGFYQSYRRYLRNLNISKEKIEELSKCLFEKQSQDWSKFQSIEDWKNFFDAKAEWMGKSWEEIRKEKSGNGYYQALIKWANEKSNSNFEIRRDLISQVNSYLRNDWSSFDSIDDWVKFYQSSSFCSSSPYALENDPQASAFYTAFTAWVRKLNKNEQEKKDYRKKIFGETYKYTDWSFAETIDDWVEIFEQHSEWLGLSTNEIGGDFYQAFCKWVNKNSENEHIKQSYIRRIFPQRKGPFLYEFDGKVVKFDSYPERIIAILLHKYGLISSFKNRQNLHVRTNGKTQHSIDFLVGNTLIEFHPLQFGEKTEGKTLEEIKQTRKSFITDPKFSGFKFFFITEVNQLLEVLKDPKIQTCLNKNYQQLNIEQFCNDFRQKLCQAHKEVKNFQTKNSRVSHLSHC